MVPVKKLVSKIVSCTMAVVAAVGIMTTTVSAYDYNKANKLCGDSYVSTSYATAKYLGYKSTSRSYSNIIVTTDEGFADAISSAYLSSVYKCPILYVHNSNSKTYNETINNIKTFAVSKANIFIVGGTGAVSSNFENQVKKAGFRTTRLSGSNRYDTNLKVLKQVNAQKSSEIMIACGTDFPDALCAASVNRPVMLVGKGGLTASQKTFLTNSKRRFTVVGGTGAVTPNTYRQLVSIAGTNNVKRISGKNRFETSAALAKAYKPNATVQVAASAYVYQDALLAATLANSKGGILVLVSGQTDKASAYNRMPVPRSQYYIFTDKWNDDDEWHVIGV